MDSALVQINGGAMGTVDVIILMTILTLLPSIIIMMTSFTRIIVVLSFLRNALGLQQTPPNLVLTGIALFLTLFIMAPVTGQIYEEAYVPYKNEAIDQSEALRRSEGPLKEFMLRQTEQKSLDLFRSFAKKPLPESPTELGMEIVIPAFITSELQRAFTMGFLIFLPFLLVDIVVASTLMSMGMMMLPPAMIALPFKILLFLLVNGWERMFSTLVSSFRF